MRKFITLCIMAGLLVLLSGCLMVSLDNFPGRTNAVYGTGEMVSRDFVVPEFTGINITGGYVVVYSHSNTNAVTIEMQENLFDYLNVGVRNGILHIDSSRPFRTGRNHTPRMYISAPYLDSVNVSGSVATENWDEISVAELMLNISGSASGIVPMDVDRLQVVIAGSVRFDLEGTASYANITISGSGEINAQGLQTETAAVSIMGSGTVEIAVSDYLNASIAGSGNVRYIGSPQVSQSIAGRGSVRQRD
ncbi:MAG: DUF2807 domain-containing protein [Firmicutes bacterium]|nr:DUF2807 domain-containing protein [Bacillota bacterium]